MTVMMKSNVNQVTMRRRKKAKEFFCVEQTKKKKRGKKKFNSWPEKKRRKKRHVNDSTTTMPKYGRQKGKVRRTQKKKSVISITRQKNYEKESYKLQITQEGSVQGAMKRGETNNLLIRHVLLAWFGFHL